MWIAAIMGAPVVGQTRSKPQTLCSASRHHVKRNPRLPANLDPPISTAPDLYYKAAHMHKQPVQQHTCTSSACRNCFTSARRTVSCLHAAASGASCAARSVFDTPSTRTSRSPLNAHSGRPHAAQGSWGNPACWVVDVEFGGLWLG